MATPTDPARELAEIAERLMQGASVSGEKFLAGQFGVEPWSTEFIRIILCIFERADLVASIVQRSGMDDDHKSNALNDLTRFKAGFAGPSLRQNWNTAGNGLTIMKDHGKPIQYLSQTVRAEVSYPRLTGDEISEFLLLIDEYLEELSKSDEGPEFVRRAIVDGLAAFRFQLKYIGWMGSGYALAAFREVMLVYEMSKRQFSDAAELDAGAVLKGLANILGAFKKKVDEAQGWASSAKTVFKWYQLGTSVVTPLLISGHIKF